MAMNDNREVTYEITEEIGVISSHQTGWNKEINMVSWNGNSPKYDICDWSPDHAQMGRGITLHEKEMRLMLDLLRRRPRIRSFRSEPGPEEEPAFMAAPAEQTAQAVPSAEAESWQEPELTGTETRPAAAETVQDARDEGDPAARA